MVDVPITVNTLDKNEVLISKIREAKPEETKEFNLMLLYSGKQLKPQYPVGNYVKKENTVIVAFLRPKEKSEDPAE